MRVRRLTRLRSFRLTGTAFRGNVAPPRRVGALAVDPHPVKARYAGTKIELARLEFALLCRLADDPLRVFTKHELLRDVWGEGS